jgi:hypothetical protein
MLTIFEYNHYKGLLKKNSAANYKSFIRKYNSGKTTSPNENAYFTKIKCDNKTYEDWCFEMNKWLLTTY